MPNHWETSTDPAPPPSASPARSEPGSRESLSDPLRTPDNTGSADRTPAHYAGESAFSWWVAADAPANRSSPVTPPGILPSPGPVPLSAADKTGTLPGIVSA